MSLARIITQKWKAALIKVFKTEVRRSQRTGKDNAKIVCCIHGLLVEDL